MPNMSIYLTDNRYDAVRGLAEATGRKASKLAAELVAEAMVDAAKNGDTRIALMNAILSNGAPLTTEDLAIVLGIPPVRAFLALLSLQTDGKVEPEGAQDKAETFRGYRWTLPESV